VDWVYLLYMILAFLKDTLRHLSIIHTRKKSHQDGRIPLVPTEGNKNTARVCMKLLEIPVRYSNGRKRDNDIGPCRTETIYLLCIAICISNQWVRRSTSLRAGSSFFQRLRIISSSWLAICSLIISKFSPSFGETSVEKVSWAINRPGRSQLRIE